MVEQLDKGSRCYKGFCKGFGLIGFLTGFRLRPGFGAEDFG